MTLLVGTFRPTYQMLKLSFLLAESYLLSEHDRQYRILQAQAPTCRNAKHLLQHF